MGRKKKDPRRDELLRICDGLDESGKVLAVRIVEEMLFIEPQLTELKALPFISVHPKNSSLQKQTAAAKQYKELLQQYINCVKVMEKLAGCENVEEESPLRSFLRQMQETKGE